MNEVVSESSDVADPCHLLSFSYQNKKAHDKKNPQGEDNVDDLLLVHDMRLSRKMLIWASKEKSGRNPSPFPLPGGRGERAKWGPEPRAAAELWKYVKSHDPRRDLLAGDFQNNGRGKDERDINEPNP